MPHDPLPEFSRPVELAKIGPLPVAETHVATASELIALARRFELPSISRLVGDVVLTQVTPDLFRMDAHLVAEAVQTCVVTLEPVPATIDARFTRLYTPRVAPDGGQEDEFLVDPEADDPPDVVTGGVIDVGEALSEQFALSLDPYPRKPGAELPPVFSGSDEKENPFAALKSLVRPH